MTIDYRDLTQRILAVAEGETDRVALMATVVCEVHHSDPRFDWTGFYRVTEPELMKIGPYQGGHGCLTIPFSRGVCGACARTGQILGPLRRIRFRRLDDILSFIHEVARQIDAERRSMPKLAIDENEASRLFDDSIDG